MLLVLTDESIYHGIADAIRERGGTEETFLPSEMADAIRRLCSFVMPFVTQSRMSDVPAMAGESSSGVVAGGVTVRTTLGRTMPFSLDSTAGKAV